MPTAIRPGFMRAPPETPYMFALESAMDELAVKLNMDPVALRRINDTMKDPVTGRPYSSRSLIECFERGAEAFGWQGRNACAWLHARRRLACRLGLRHRLLSDPDRAARGARPSDPGRDGAGVRSPPMRSAPAPRPSSARPRPKRLGFRSTK